MTLKSYAAYVQTEIKTVKKFFSIMSNLQTHFHFKLDFQNMDQHTTRTISWSDNVDQIYVPYGVTRSQSDKEW